MKHLKKNVRTTLLLAVACLLLAISSVGITKAQLEYFSKDYVAWFYLNHLQVFLLENGEITYDGALNDLDGPSKKVGKLLTWDPIGYQDENNPGTIEPGLTYKEEISARNGSDIEEYVRLTVRKYWVDQDGKKTTKLEPALIHLTYNDSDLTDGKDTYNDSAWVINPAETTTESSTYYYRTILSGNTDSALLFNELTIDGSVIDDSHMTETITKEGTKTIYTYTYDYDDYTFYIEADVQAIQTHNVMDAIHSQWGVYNVTAGNGSLSVN